MGISRSGEAKDLLECLLELITDFWLSSSILLLLLGELSYLSDLCDLPDEFCLSNKSCCS